ncbi:MAG TPA: SEC-C metal-binding domain-containing protein, partial [Thermoanaerobaculia bacterium]|nr:SEC-C metal-binding domain-containing protein [Thermoanaerobaculia bacterium]
MTKIGRNDPCNCGSGKKWKKCHGASADSGRNVPERTTPALNAVGPPTRLAA